MRIGLHRSHRLPSLRIFDENIDCCFWDGNTSPVTNNSAKRPVVPFEGLVELAQFASSLHQEGTEKECADAWYTWQCGQSQAKICATWAPSAVGH